jgi:hypothetical protein
MGSSKWSSDAYMHLKSSYSTRSREEIFSSTTINTLMSPYNIKFREARDSGNHPNSLPIIIALDVTGSMGHIPEFLIKEKLGTLIETLISHGVSDPAVLFCAIGDHRFDNAPLQIGQFESGALELNKWLSTTWLEGGGGDAPESYGLAHIFAGKHTSVDSFEKRKQKGYLFTVGDQVAHRTYEGEYLAKIFGPTYQKGMNVSLVDAIEIAQNSYNVFHLSINEISNQEVLKDWRNLLGQNAIGVNDHKLIAEVIASTVAIFNGADIDKVTSGFDLKTSYDVKYALDHIDTRIIKRSDKIIEL